jgi:hypothetical protein
VVEREFWRLVENAFETAEVEYGADLHSSQHGRYSFIDQFSSVPQNTTSQIVLTRVILHKLADSRCDRAILITNTRLIPST